MDALLSTQRPGDLPVLLGFASSVLQGIHSLVLVVGLSCMVMWSSLSTLDHYFSDIEMMLSLDSFLIFLIRSKVLLQ